MNDDGVYPKWRRAARVVGSLAVAFGGGCLVLGLILTMNSAVEAPESNAQAAAPAVSIKRAPKPPAARRPKPKPKPKRARRSVKAPPPNLSADLGGVSLSLPAFEGFDLGGSQDLLGDTAAAENLVMTADTVDQKPRPRRRVGPRYPPRANAQRVEGYVKLSLLVNSRGEPTRVRVLESVPPGVFDQAAVDAIGQWEFEPATYQGQAVQMRITQRIVFKL